MYYTHASVCTAAWKTFLEEHLAFPAAAVKASQLRDNIFLEGSGDTTVKVKRKNVSEIYPLEAVIFYSSLGLWWL